ncbi:hypothetical protein ACFSC3_03540 [Sphingomonas floccifaciens]|uniref:Uncharacterized protein n=1 Tax=Sphingomonas floccifaciens TaxID=1844115 RepID=A0ABW4NAY5_9SPHN
MAKDDQTPEPLHKPLPDDIPMTGEEDPLVEVEDPDFAPIAAEFMRSERAKKADG